ncbi:hypothetical protein WSS15_11570 [Acetobacter pasteurianus]|uniref:hypothetical protein n=1 Tax=Acetobacter pasteurianus TaxID=438 RepID=UPI0022C30D47|nr:hypothetical protein [Acetobacter pasteurianus]GLH28507.1 hypothetical protein WSS15_11570 [Acetobacter pasteurianus]
MTETSAASQLAGAMRAAISHKATATHAPSKPEHIAGNAKISSGHSGGSETSMQFDATGQIIPSAKGEKKGSATESLVNLLA